MRSAVERQRDLPGVKPGIVVGEDAPDHRGLARMDDAFAGANPANAVGIGDDLGAIAVADAARHQTIEHHAAFLIALDPLRHVAAELLRHDGADADKDWRDQTIGAGVHRHAVELQLLVEPRGVGQIAREAIKVLEHHRLELAGLRAAHQLLHAGPGDEAAAIDARVLNLPRHREGPRASHTCCSSDCWSVIERAF